MTVLYPNLCYEVGFKGTVMYKQNKNNTFPYIYQSITILSLMQSKRTSYRV